MHSTQNTTANARTGHLPLRCFFVFLQLMLAKSWCREIKQVTPKGVAVLNLPISGA
jgi:hypothetical protein